MKKAILLIVIMTSSSVVFSQSTLKGPRAKNATAIELAANASLLKFYSSPNEIKGVDAKSFKSWEKAAINTNVIYFRKELDLPKGPKAKNLKVWE